MVPLKKAEEAGGTGRHGNLDDGTGKKQLRANGGKEI